MTSELFQLAGRYKGEMPNNVSVIEEKIDGFRAGYWRGLDGTASLWSRNGHEIHGAGHIMHVLAAMERIAGDTYMFDGEFQVGGTLLATKRWCEREWKSGGNAGILHLFDAMPEREWKLGGCSMPLIERKARLQALYEGYINELASDWAWQEKTRGEEPDAPPISILTHDMTMSASGVQMMANAVWKRGGEGLVVKDPNAAYVRGRCNSWMKVKKEGAK